MQHLQTQQTTIIIIIIQHATTNLLLWWWRQKLLYRVSWLCRYLANKFIAITVHSSNKYYCLYVSHRCLKSLKRKFYCPLMILFAFTFCVYELWHLLVLIGFLFQRNLLLTYVRFTQLWKILLNEFLSQSSDINDLNCDNLKFTIAYLTEWLPVWVHWTQFFKINLEQSAPDVATSVTMFWWCGKFIYF